MNVEEFDNIVKDLDYNIYLKNNNNYNYFGVLLLLIPKDGEYHILFEKRAKNISQPNEICFPGGRYDKMDTTIKDTAIRETYEEVGIHPSEIRILGKLRDSFTPKGYTVSCYIASASNIMDTLKINKNEVSKVFTIPLRYFIEHEPNKYNLKIKATYKNLIKGVDKEIFPKDKTKLPLKNETLINDSIIPAYMYETKEGALWGLTAGFIKEFVDIIKNSMKN